MTHGIDITHIFDVFTSKIICGHMNGGIIGDVWKRLHFDA